jgi:hypothetical protein
VPFVPDGLAAAAGVSAPSLQASLQGIARIREVAEQLGVIIFVSAVIPVCSHTAPYFFEMAQTAISASTDVIYVESSSSQDVSRLIDGTVIASAHSAATQAGIAFFGDGCEDYLLGTPLYSVIRQDDE